MGREDKREGEGTKVGGRPGGEEKRREKKRKVREHAPWESIIDSA